MFEGLKNWLSQLLLACVVVLTGGATMPIAQGAMQQTGHGNVPVMVASKAANKKKVPAPVGVPLPPPPTSPIKPLPPVPNPEPTPKPFDPPIVLQPPVDWCQYSDSFSKTSASFACPCHYAVGATDTIRACGPPPKGLPLD